MVKIMNFLWERSRIAGELSRELCLSPSYLTKIADKLEQESYIVKTREGKSIRLTAIYNERTQHLKEFVKKYSKAEEIVENESIMKILLSIINEEKTTREIELSTGLSISTIKNALPKLKNKSMIKKSEHGYLFNKILWYDLYGYLRAYSPYTKENAILLFKRGHEEILETSGEIKDAVLTGFSRFEGYGVKISLVSNYYYKPSRKLSMHEILAHALHCIKDIRGIAFVIAFIKKNKIDKNKAIEKASYYDKKKLMITIFDAIKSDNNDMIINRYDTTRKELNDILETYGVKI
jgi:DNA-binding MarR family transcriptional regulator